MPTFESIDGTRACCVSEVDGRSLIGRRYRNVARSLQFLHAVQGPKSVTQICQKRPVIQRLPRDPATELDGPVPLPVPMEVLGEPDPEPAELAAPEVVVQARQIPAGGGHELSRVK